MDRTAPTRLVPRLLPRLLLCLALATVTLTACLPGGDDCEGPRAAWSTAWTGVPAQAAGAYVVEPGVTMYADDADLSADGRRLAVACDGEVCLWDPTTGLRLPGPEAAGRHLSWAGVEEAVLVGTGHDSGAEQGVVHLPTPDGVCTMAGAHDIDFVTDSPAPGPDLAAGDDGRLLATGAGDGRVGLWSTQQRRRLAWLDSDVDHTGTLAFSPDGDLLVVGDSDGSSEIWDVAERERVAVVDASLAEVAWSPDGATLAGVLVGGEQVVTLDARTWRTDASLGGVDVRGLAWAPDSSRLALVPGDDAPPVVGSWTPGETGTVPLATHDQQPLSAFWAPDGSALYTIDSYTGVRRTPLTGLRPSGPATTFEAPEPIVG